MTYYGNNGSRQRKIVGNDDDDQPGSRYAIK